MRKQDNIFEKGNLGDLPFTFNDEVAEVFEDMIDRSVPGYKTSLKLISLFSKQYYKDNTNCYDVGCSLGASSLSILRGAKSAKVIAIDNSEAMINACIDGHKELISQDKILFVKENVCDAKLENASIIVINYVVQFLAIHERDKLIKKAYDALVQGGVLIISEKIHFKNPYEANRLFKLHHQFKLANGYSELEIASKRDSLEGVLLTETQEDHTQRAIRAGFTRVEKVLSNLNFVTYRFEK